MAGINNNIPFGNGYRLEPSAAADIIVMQNKPMDVSRVNFVGDPNGNVSANPSSLCHDPVSGNVWIKVSGTGNTVWELIAFNGGATFTWIDVTDGSSPIVLIPNTGYYSDDTSSNITFNLPAIAAKFSIIRITNLQPSFNFTITQAAGQSIQFGIKSTTVGAGGSITSTQIGDSIELICTVDSLQWQVLSSVGNLTFV